MGSVPDLVNQSPELVIVTEEFNDPVNRMILQKAKRGDTIYMLLKDGGKASAGDNVFDVVQNRRLGAAALFSSIRALESRPRSGGAVSAPAAPVYAAPPSEPTTSNQFAGHPTPSKLTPREREVAELLTRGMSNREIAGVIGTGEQNVKLYIRRLLRHFGHKSRVQLALRLQGERHLLAPRS